MSASAATEGLVQTSVLVVGDWLVDEHWVVGKHRSATSSRTGFDHSRALHNDECSVRSLCGAGQVATILHQALSVGRPPFNVIGVGVWHPEDTYSLASMLDPEFNAGKTPHRLSSDIPPSSASVAMYNLAGSASQPLVRAGTTRIIRIYENTPRGLVQRQRLDWELPLSASGSESMWAHMPQSLHDLFERGSEIQHILVKDLRKGSVDTTLIKALFNEFKGARWYISSKEWKPEWLGVLRRKADIELLIVPPVAAQRAVNREEEHLSSWLMVDGEPSYEALATTEKLAKDYAIKRIVVHPSDAAILAYEPGEEAHGFVLPSDRRRHAVPFTPMASVFFPTLVAKLIVSDIPEPFGTVLKQAAAFTEQWQQDESQRLTRENWTPSAKQILHLDNLSDMPTTAQWHTYDWGQASKEWSDALSEFGIVDVPDPQTGGVRHEFQLWRGMTEIGEYIACTPQKRIALSRIYREGKALAKTPRDERRHKSFLIVDGPGSGKSFMVQCLRNALGMESRHYNITRLLNRNELFDCFQDIASAQSGHRDPLLVFVDELNSKIGGHHIYDAFLEPLEDGRFVRSGSVATIAPCLWIFAGTENPSGSGASDHGNDFEQRLSAPAIHFQPRSQSNEDELTKVERVYVGVACLLQRFPEVKKVSRPVLQAFWMMNQAVPREVRRFVWDFEDVQYSRVMTRNLPRDYQRKYGQLLTGSSQKANDDESLLVEIKRRPGD